MKVKQINLHVSHDKPCLCLEQEVRSEGEPSRLKQTSCTDLSGFLS